MFNETIYIRNLSEKQAQEACSKLQTVGQFSFKGNSLQELSLTKYSDWVAVPVESNSHFDLEFQVQLQRIATENGYQELIAVVLERIEEYPSVFIVPSTHEGIEEFNRVCGHFPCLLFAGNPDWVIICTLSDYFAVVGSTLFVTQLLRRRPESIFSEFDAFIASLHWPEQFEAKLNELKEYLYIVRRKLHDEYTNTPVGSVIELLALSR